MKKALVFSLIFSILISIAYFSLISPTVYWEDSGEFITTAKNLGIAHPPGHPLYITLAHLFTLKTDLEHSALRVNAFSVFCSFFSLLLFSLFLILMLSSIFGLRKTKFLYATIFSSLLLFAFSKTFWYYTEIAEVYTLHTLLSISLFVSLFLFAKKAGKFILLFSYLFGLSLCNNVTITFLFPAFFTFIILERKKLETRYILPSILLFFLGISFYLYIPIRARFNPVFNWGNAYNIRNFISLLTAREFSKGFFTLQYTEKSINPFFTKFLREISYWTIIPIVFGFIKLKRKANNILIFFLLTIIFNVVLSFFTGRGPDFYAYFLPSFFVLFVVAGIGIMNIIAIVKNKGLRLCLSLFIVLLSLLPLLLNYQEDSRKGDFDAKNYGETLLHWLPPNSILLTENTNDYFILKYLREIQQKKDIDIFYIPLFSEDWFINDIKSSGYDWTGKLTPFSLFASSERTFFYTPGAGISLPERNIIPLGPLFQIVGNSEQLTANNFTLPHPRHTKGKLRYSILYSRFGEYYFLRKKYDLSIAAFEKALTFDPHNPAITHNLAVLRKKIIEKQKMD